MIDKHLDPRRSIRGRSAAAASIVVIAGLAISDISVGAQAPAPTVVNAQGQTQSAGSDESAAAPGANTSSAYILAPSDEVVIHAVDAPEISEKTQRIDPDGDLRMALVGRIRAAGMTVNQLEDELRKRLQVYLQQPDVTVTVTNARSQSVSVTGAVTQPGLKPVIAGQTLLDVLSAAGGLSPDAGPTVRVIRKPEQGAIPLPSAVSGANGFSTVDVDARGLLEGRNPESNIEIYPNDAIAVPRAELIYVIGEVGRPGAVQLTSNRRTTVMEAVSASGGVLRTASSRKARILRRVPGQEARLEIPVDISSMMQGKANDVPMAVGDILVVPDSNGKRFTTRAVEAAIQVGMMVGTYGLVR